MLASLADSSISDGEHIVVVLVIGPGAYVSGVMEIYVVQATDHMSTFVPLAGSPPDNATRALRLMPDSMR